MANKVYEKLGWHVLAGNSGKLMDGRKIKDGRWLTAKDGRDGRGWRSYAKQISVCNVGMHMCPDLLRAIDCRKWSGAHCAVQPGLASRRNRRLKTMTVCRVAICGDVKLNDDLYEKWAGRHRKVLWSVVVPASPVPSGFGNLFWWECYDPTFLEASIRKAYKRKYGRELKERLF